MHAARMLVNGCLIFSLLATFGSGLAAAQATTTGASPAQEAIAAADLYSPFQRTVKQAIAERTAAGLPVPAAVTYETTVLPEPALTEPLAAAAGLGQSFKVVSKTIFDFDNPGQAGYKAWPALVVSDGLPEGVHGTVAVGDYTEAYRAFMDARIPGVWDRVDFGQEPRRHTVTETFEVTYPAVDGLAAAAATSPDAVAPGEILTGFSYTGPHIDYAIEKSDKACIWPFPCVTIYYFKAGLEADWALGLRLPFRTELTYPDPLVQGTWPELTAALTPMNWSASDYTRAGVAGEAGNEFVLRLEFFVGIHGEVLGVNICSGCYVDKAVNQSASFVPPLGPGAVFPVTTANIPLYDLDLRLVSFKAGFQLTPHLGAKQVTADWQASGDAVGSGSLSFTQPGTQMVLPSCQICNVSAGTDAQFQLQNFRYWFNQFLVELSAFMQIKLFGYGVWNPTISISNFDLSHVTGDLYVGRHQQCDWDFDCTGVGPNNRITVLVPAEDQGMPVSTLSLSSDAAGTDWYRADVSAGLTAVDYPLGCAAGIDRLEYRLNGGDWTIYTGPLLIDREGLTDLDYRAVDADGNAESPQSTTVQVDKTPPVITGAVLNPPNAAGWHSNDVTVHFTAADSVSGLAAVTPDLTISTEGAGQSATGTASDNAGHTATVTVSGINLDKTAPEISIDSPESRHYGRLEPINFTCVTSDSLSGIDSEMMWFDGDAIANGTAIQSMTLAGGTHEVVVKATDQADNERQEVISFSTDAYIFTPFISGGDR